MVMNSEKPVIDSKILVSVIIPVYNTEKYIEKCLNSVINQTYTNLEIIVINDASTDSTLDIVNKFAHRDARIKIINHTVNKGNGIGRNTGIKTATGEYISFVDSDDYIEKDTIEKMLKAILQSNVDLAALGYMEHHENKPIRKKKSVDDPCIKLPKITGEESKEEIFKLFLLQFNGICFQPWTHFMKRELLINNNIFFDESGMYYEDMIFSTKLVYFSSGIVPVKEALYHYLLRKNSITQTKARKTIESKMYALMTIKQFLKEQNVFDTYKDYYTLFFICSGFIKSVMDVIEMTKRDKEVEQFLYELSREKLIQNFNVKQLNLPDKTLFVKSYKETQQMVLVLGKFFYPFIRYARFMIKLRNILALLNPFRRTISDSN